MTPELKYLTWTAVLTALLWIPYVLDRMARNRLSDVVGYPATPPTTAAWAERLKKAHSNAVENLVVFASLVLVANALDISNNATTSAAAAYFWARLVHPVAYTLGIPWVRTLAFAVAWGGILCIAWQVIAQP
ncbi:MAG: MAPEG family protein [Lysobacterales bacterium]|nr:MAG: MAPEG family protein [Xanthomonadales bacterium]